jgi:hypothetical protein
VPILLRRVTTQILLVDTDVSRLVQGLSDAAFLSSTRVRSSLPLVQSNAKVTLVVALLAEPLHHRRAPRPGGLRLLLILLPQK